MHFVITDSGLGGLGVCAALERDLRLSGRAAGVHLTYFSAWPEEGVGYNAMPDIATRLGYFDRALARMNRERPDRIIIACNTLSILYGQTAFARTADVPVLGIIETGIELFRHALAANPASGIALFGTRITIDSGAHRNGLVQRGIQADRISAAGCHGLAVAIEQDIRSGEVDRLIEECAAQIPQPVAGDGTLFAGLCCTHYSYVAGRIRRALERHSGRSVEILDPNQALVDEVVQEMPAAVARAAHEHATVSVLSKVAISDQARHSIGQLVQDLSPATAEALNHYRHVPNLF